MHLIEVLSNEDARGWGVSNITKIMKPMNIVFGIIKIRRYRQIVLHARANTV